MDALLERLGVQAVNYAIRSGIAITSTYAVQQCSRLLKTVNDRGIHKELKSLQKLLESKSRIISPAIDLIEFKSGRGNIFLESAVPLAKSLHREIVRLGKRLDNAATTEEGLSLAGAGCKGRMSEAHHAELTLIMRDIKDLLARIDRDIPLIQLAITASGEKMSSALAPGISPSRMMQASTLLSFGDAQFAGDPHRPVQVGPCFTLSLYMLFLGHSQVKVGAELGGEDASSSTKEVPERAAPNEVPYGIGEGERRPIWQEVMHKARVRLCRTPLDWTFDRIRGYCPTGSPDLELNGSISVTSIMAMFARSDEYSYHLEIIEDLDDDRVHEEDGPHPQPFNDMPMAGIRESIPIYQIAKIFYTDTGRILNIRDAGDGENNPVLLLKRDANAKTPIGLRKEWFEDSDGSQGDSLDESQHEPQSQKINSSSASSNDQAEIDRQLQEESGIDAKSVEAHNGPKAGQLPAHLDPEWLALEVFMEDDNEDDTETEDEASPDPSESVSDRRQAMVSSGLWRDRLSVDSNLLAQLKSISLRPNPPPHAILDPSFGQVGTSEVEVPEPKVARSPFGPIVSSLSLLEMLIRLTSLQEFQQTPHLSIPDHILTFFLDETSTTGLSGQAHWALRNAAKRRMGFDPYTDTPAK
ncbi:RanGTP-binding protein-domain-containing protein [Lasiosphaeria hispida]|uniref:RanGTP-binding protein-domain-containing protein n=1 Tax=Lasiosphaeria hispida TaxID=260671 RepID=A0AAJ0HFI8_9PEZI|nr:RanGTP-binding protein-domain-containing protein [Lasiosphaeria hispida]